MEIYTLGFAGRFPFSQRVLNYMDRIILDNLQRGRELWLMLSVHRKSDRAMVDWVLTIKTEFPELRLVLVVTESEYQTHSNSESSHERQRLIAAADRCEIITCTSAGGRMYADHEKFIGCCDEIVYSNYLTPPYIQQDFAYRLSEFEGKRPRVRYMLAELSFTQSEIQPSLVTLSRSITYIRKSGWRVLTDTLPQELLDQWLRYSKVPTHYTEPTALEDVTDLFRFENPRAGHYLLFKVFTFAYVANEYQPLIMSDSTFNNGLCYRFRQFRRLLEMLDEGRRKEIEVGSYNLLDFENYDNVFELFGITEQLEQSMTRLCDAESPNTFSTDEECN